MEMGRHCHDSLNFVLLAFMCPTPDYCACVVQGRTDRAVLDFTKAIELAPEVCRDIKQGLLLDGDPVL